MATRNALSGVLTNFLGAYVSRYSEYNGYWMFGSLVPDFTMLSIDLLGNVTDEAITPISVARNRAVARFNDQLIKAGLSPADVSAASLAIHRSLEPVTGKVNGYCCIGYQVIFAAEGTMASGKQYQSCRLAFIAPHNPHYERQSVRNA